ncbi:MAG: iduronate-2-sulfatase [Rhodopirellula sp.]|nr:iduronate-2-sulfatase [Rhodopirellula sp.]|tara:strand:- start:21544 stop:22986 length:1443 start_codon:yes stop_codon:yes gene_type:complete
MLSRIYLVLAAVLMTCTPCLGNEGPYNVLFIISDDLTDTALSCYGNTVCQTPNIDAIAKQGVRFTKAYCQGTYCGPSRASLMSGYYPHAIKMLGYKTPRPMIGDRMMWPEFFRQHGYYTARVSKLFHMGVPGGIEQGGHGEDDQRCWTERYNSQGPEWKAAGQGWTLEGNPDRTVPVKGGNTFVVVEADGDDLAHSDGRTAEKAAELIKKHSQRPFFMGVGFVRPHVPFVAPKKYYQSFPYDSMKLPEKLAGDWDDIPAAGINYKTSKNMKMDLEQQRKAVGGYYASVSYMDAQVGKVMKALEESGVADRTIVIFTSDHGYHLGEHDFWAKVSLHDESARVPLIISVPGKQPAVCDSLVELLDLYPTMANLCGFKAPVRLQGKDISRLLDNPDNAVRDAAFSVNGKGYLLRTAEWAYMRYGANGNNGEELFDMVNDPKQYTNLVGKEKYQQKLESLRTAMDEKLASVLNNDLELTYSTKP